MTSTLIGHGPVVDVLGSEIDRPAHAYLFTGPSNVGKATVARWFAAGLLCGDDEACRRRVFSGNHPDLEVVEPDGRTSLTVGTARRAASRATLAPMEGDRKVFMFEEAGSMTDEAANALLKTLEEPTATTVFLLVTESEAELPATVASRCRVVVFGRVADDEIGAGLRARGVDEAQAEGVAAAAGGRPGLALVLATQPEVADFRSAWLTIPSRLDDQPGTAVRLAAEMVAATKPLIGGLAAEQKTAVEEARDAGHDTKALEERHDREQRRATSALHRTGLEILASWYRDAAVAQFDGPVRNTDVPGTALAGVSARKAVAAAERIQAAIDALERNQRAELAFAALFSDLGTAS